MKKFTVGVVVSLLLILGLNLKTFSQGEANIWYMGDGSGLDFNFNPPAQRSDGNAGLISATGEGVSSICDAAGSLLFYTNGNVVYDRAHVAMTNGTGLNGNGTTTQTGVIVKRPGSSDIYYVFTPTDVDGSIRYSTVDMTLRAGFGDVVAATKNTLLRATGSESCVAIPHDNGIDMWVLFHGSTVAEYYVCLVTSAGVSALTTYAVGTSGQATMQMKVNSCYNKIASIFYNFGKVEIVSFNNTTGVVSNTGMVTLQGTGAGNAFNALEVYSAEFSPNGNVLYVSESGLNGRDDIHQFDISSGTGVNPPAIIASRKTHLGGTTIRAGTLQLAPNGRIYVPGYTTAVPAYLSEIASPDVLWAASPPTAAEFAYLKYTYMTKRVGEGLPPIVRSVLTSLKVFYNNACEGTATNFSFIFGSAVNAAAGSISWNFGDGSPVVLDQYTPSHTYATAGTYNATLTVLDVCGRTRSQTVPVIVKTGPTVTVGALWCTGSGSVTLTGTGSNAVNYLWSMSSTMSSPSGPSSTFVYTGTLPTTVYVQDTTSLANYVAGNPPAVAHIASNTGYTYFDLNTTVLFKSFEVLSRGAGTATFSIRDAATATTIYWSSTCSPTASGQTFVISPNITLASGSYVLYVTPDDVLFNKNNTTTGSQRDVLGVISVTGEKNLTRGGLFFNLRVAIPDPCGIRAIPLAPNCAAPIDLLAFYGEESGDKINLFWKAASELNNDYFLVQRSSDGLNFTTIGTVDGKGTINKNTSYFYPDEEPLKGVNYYRLAQVDYDGTTTHTNILSFEVGAFNVSVSPNPFTEYATIGISSTQELHVDVLDLLGRTVEMITKEAGQQKVIVGESLRKGTYFIRVANDTNVFTSKIIKE